MSQVETQETGAEVIAMTDGRLVEFAGKRKLLKSHSIQDDKVAVVLDFRNGETRTFTVPPDLLTRFAAHGAEQKLGDEVAGIKEVDDMVLAVDELIDRLYNGEWSSRREGGAGMNGASVLMRALMEMTGKSQEDIKTFLQGKTQAEKLALRANTRLRPIIERLEASKTSSVDSEALLGELDAPAVEGKKSKQKSDQVAKA